MDKQIIIDGCDVSGCECYSEHHEGYCGWHIPCEGDICPYKLKWALQQLKCKEDKINKIEDICDNILENYMKHSLACVDLAGKITDIINDIKQEVNNDR